VIAAGRYVAAAVYLALLLRHSPSLGRVDTGLARRMFAYGFRVYLAIVLSYLVVRFDLLLVNGYLGEAQAGIYGVAATLADGMFVLPMVISLNLFSARGAWRPDRGGRPRSFRSVAVLYGLFCLRPSRWPGRRSARSSERTTRAPPRCTTGCSPGSMRSGW